MMEKRVSLSSLWLCLVLSTLYNSPFVLAQRGAFRPHPEYQPEYSPDYSPPKAPVPDADDGGALQPFQRPSNTPSPSYMSIVQVPNGVFANQRAIRADDYYFTATLQPLLQSLAQTMSELGDQISSESTSVDLATVSVPSSAAEIGCSIYSAYQSICRPGTPTPITIAAITYTPASSDLFAECACYSGTWWVPDLYDNAVWACNALSSTEPGFPSWVTTATDSSTMTRGFCEDNNPKAASFAYALATTTTTAATMSQSTSNPASATTAATQASPTTTSSATIVMGTGLHWRGRMGWSLIVAVAVVITLI